jgi:hypothetical protein
MEEKFSQIGLAHLPGMRHNGTEANAMANLNLEVPDDLARTLAGIAAAQHKSIQQLAVERLSSLVEASPERGVGSATALLQAMNEPPHLSGPDVDQLEAAIADGRLPIRTRELFPD